MNAPAPPARTVSGWFAVEADGVIHGWARDKAAPDERLTVRIAIDGEAVATLRCDRFVPSLRDQNESDGFSGFSCAVPPRWCDGRPHAVTVDMVAPDGENESAGEGVPLRSKRPDFMRAVDATVPHLLLTAGDDTGVEGVLAGPHLREALDLWVGDRRLPPPDAIDWRWEEGKARAFRLPWDGGVLALAASGVRLAYPGTREAGLPGVAVADMLAGEVRRTPDGCRLGLDPRLDLDDRPLDGEVADGVAVHPVAIRIARGEGSFDLPDAVTAGTCTLRLKDRAGRPLPDALTFDAGTPGWAIPNADLSRWGAGGPDGFQAGPVARGFHAFPPALKAELGLSGHLALIDLPGSADALLLAHPLPPATGIGGATVGVRLFARASAPVDLAWVVERDGEAVARCLLSLAPRWRSFHARFSVPGDPRALRLALVRGEEGDPVRVEVAGLAAGAADAQGFADPALPPPPPAPGANLVRNAALTRWPHGLAVDAQGPRVPLADGWTLVSAGDAPVRATAVAGDPDGHALALSVPAPPSPCSLEVALDGGETADAGRLRFRVRLGAGAGRFGLVDRIALVRRRMGGGDETPVAVIARKLAVGADWDGHDRPFFCRAGTERRFERTGGGFELVLRFDFHAPLAVEIGGLDLRLGGGAAVLPPAPAPLAFEDPAIRAQLGLVKGLESWRAADALRPGPAGPVPGRPPAEPRRWSWSAMPGTVEVAVPVHDAADETLACLASLTGTTSVPHLVHVLDDGSAEPTRARIAAFVADRPWMRLTLGRRRGYTAAANRLVGRSSADWVVLLNSDTVVTPGWLEGLLAAAAGDERTAMAGPVSNAASTQSVPDTHDGAGGWAVNPLPPGWTPADMAALVRRVGAAEHPEVPLLNGFCSLIRRAAFTAVGGFDERRFPAGYGEENDLCLRLAKAGWRLRVADDVYVWHAKSASFGPRRRAELSKAGDKALREAHPDVDVTELGRRFLATPALARLRDAVRAALPPVVVPAPVGEGG